MLHAKFQDHRTLGSREEDFKRFKPYMGMAAMLTKTIFITFVPLSPRRIHIKVGFDWPSISIENDV